MPRKKTQGDRLTIEVYEKAGFPPAHHDILYDHIDFLMDARKDAIRERTGQNMVGKWAVIEDSEHVLIQSGLDRIMRESLLSRGYASDLLLFMAHSDNIRLADRSTLRKTTLEGTYNRALLAMKEDIKAIDEAVTAVTSKGRSRT